MLGLYKLRIKLQSENFVYSKTISKYEGQWIV
jgi:hypothetical protein